MGRTEFLHLKTFRTGRRKSSLDSDLRMWSCITLQRKKARSKLGRIEKPADPGILRHPNPVDSIPCVCARIQIWESWESGSVASPSWVHCTWQSSSVQISVCDEQSSYTKMNVTYGVYLVGPIMALIFSAADCGSVLGMAHYSVFKGNVKLVYKKSLKSSRKNK